MCVCVPMCAFYILQSLDYQNFNSYFLVTTFLTFSFKLLIVL